MFALILKAGYEQRISHNVRTLWGALDTLIENRLADRLTNRLMFNRIIIGGAEREATLVSMLWSQLWIKIRQGNGPTAC